MTTTILTATRKTLAGKYGVMAQVLQLAKDVRTDSIPAHDLLNEAHGKLQAALKVIDAVLKAPKQAPKSDPVPVPVEETKTPAPVVTPTVQKALTLAEQRAALQGECGRKGIDATLLSVAEMRAALGTPTPVQTPAKVEKPKAQPKPKAAAKQVTKPTTTVQTVDVMANVANMPKDLLLSILAAQSVDTLRTMVSECLTEGEVLKGIESHVAKLGN